MRLSSKHEWGRLTAQLVLFPLLFSLGFVSLGLYSLRLPPDDSLAMLAPAVFFVTVCLGWFTTAYHGVTRTRGLIGALGFLIPGLAVISVLLWIPVILKVEPTLVFSPLRLPVSLLMLCLLVYGSFISRSILVGHRRRFRSSASVEEREEGAWVPPLPPFLVRPNDGPPGQDPKQVNPRPAVLQPWGAGLAAETALMATCITLGTATILRATAGLFDGHGGASAILGIGGGLLVAFVGLTVVYPYGAMRGGVWADGFRPPAPRMGGIRFVRRGCRGLIGWDEVERVIIHRASVTSAPYSIAVELSWGDRYVFSLVGPSQARDGMVAPAIVRQWMAHGRKLSVVTDPSPEPTGPANTTAPGSDRQRQA